MAGEWGGARTPSNPAVVSGPGAMSARTDGGVLDSNEDAYGDKQSLDTMRTGAPLAGTRGAPAGAPGAPVQHPLAGLQGMLGAPTANPNMPITAGAAAGVGPGPEALGLPADPVQEANADARALGPALVAMMAAASDPNAPPSFKRLVRTVVSNLR